ncbi:MAG: hypothetical protein HC767_14050 [Akkermansiaceae bacterium]|nr:hypothetical protein [Akkermansiaceae bacterium]
MLHETLEYACRMYDKDRSGTINFEEFQGLVGAHGNHVVA